jgi:hypothetical protein
MLLPSEYVSLLIINSLTPRQAWTRVKAAVDASGDLQHCTVLLDWLHVAIVSAGVNQPLSFLARQPLCYQ